MQTQNLISSFVLFSFLGILGGSLAARALRVSGTSALASWAFWVGAAILVSGTVIATTISFVRHLYLSASIPLLAIILGFCVEITTKFGEQSIRSILRTGKRK